MNNLFVASTSYQLLTALNMSLQLYSSSDFYNYIVFLSSDISRSIKSDGIEVKLNGKVTIIPREEYVNFIKKQKFEKVQHFIFFQENSILNRYLASKLKRKGCLISLAPDGAKPYGVFSKSHEFVSCIKDTLLDYKSLFQKRLFPSTFLISRYYRYGISPFIDMVWLEYPTLFNKNVNRTKAEIKELPKLSKLSIELLDNLYNGGSSTKIYNDCIIYFNQPIWSEKLKSKEVEVLDFLQRKYPNKDFYLKLHPKTREAIPSHLGNFPQIKFINDNAPAEVLISNSNNCLFFTPWSTALMHPLGENNSYFYLFSEFKKSNDTILNQIDIIRFPHISFQEIDV